MKPSQLVAIQLSTVLPKDYMEFLDNTGYMYLVTLGLEIYGFKQGFDIEKIPCVVAATNLNKEAYKLSPSEIVISHTGFEELITILDCVTGKVSELDFDGIRSPKAESFSEWLSGLTLRSSN